MIDIERGIASELGEATRKVPRRVLPDWVVKLVALFDPTVKQVVPELGREVRVDNTLTQEVLGAKTRCRAPLARPRAAQVEMNLIDNPLGNRASTDSGHLPTNDLPRTNPGLIDARLDRMGTVDEYVLDAA